MISVSTNQNNVSCRADKNRFVLSSVTADTLSIGSLLGTPISRWGGLELALTLLRVALAWHDAGSSTPKDPRVNDSLGVRP